MGIFDKKSSKHKDTTPEALPDAAIASVDLSSNTAAELPETVVYFTPPALDSVDAPAGEEGEKSAATSASSNTATQRAKPTYGIEQAIALMRTLPSDNIELAVQVVKHTLESAAIDISAIIADAVAKQGSIDKRVDVLNGETRALEAQIKSRAEELSSLEKARSETMQVRERLELADKLDKLDKIDKIETSSADSESKAP